MLQPQTITEHYINQYLKTGDTVIDATAGNGYDTLKLCRAVGENGIVFAFDIQESALNATQKLLNSNGFNAILIHDSHSNIDSHIKKNVKAVIFNLGYLPGGDHKIQTTGATTLEAIEKSLQLLENNGFISITVYYGKNSGTEEKEILMEYFKTLNHKKYTVLVHDFYNRPNNPPLTVVITKNEVL